MSNDAFEIYRAVIEDTNQINSRRQGLDNLYVSIVTLVLAGDATVVATAQFDNWLPVVATVGIGLVGIAITGRWRQGIADLDEVLGYRYAWLRELEQNPVLAAAGASIFSQEYEHIFKKRESSKEQRSILFARRTRRLQAIFLTVFVIIPMLLAALTYGAGIPEIHQYIRPLLPSSIR
jgi:hypothetical protein